MKSSIYSFVFSNNDGSCLLPYHLLLMSLSLYIYLFYISHCIFTYLFGSCWTSSPPVLEYCELCCFEHPITSLLVHRCIIFVGYIPRHGTSGS